MTQPIRAGAGGFRIADGFVEISGRHDRAATQRAAQEAGDDFDREFHQAAGKDRGRSRELGGRFSKNILRGLVDGFGRDRTTGRSIGQTMLSGIADGILKPNPAVLMALRTGIPAVLSSPFGLAAAALGAVFVASFVSAVITSGALALIGVAFAGLGAFAIRESQAVQSAWSRVARRVGSAFAESARNLVGPFKTSLDEIGSFFVTTIAPRLRNIFEAIAPGIQPLFEALAKTVDAFLARIEPGMGRLVHQFLIPFADQLPRLGDAVGRLFETFIRNAPTIAEGWRHIVDMVVLLVDILGFLLVTLTRVWDWFNRIQAVVSPLTAMLERFAGSAEGAGGALQNLARFFSPVLGAMGLFKDDTRDATDAGVSFATTMSGSVVAALQTAMAESSGLRRQMVETTRSMFTATKEAGSLYDALLLLNGGALAARAAERQFQQAIDQATQSIEDNGRSLDVNTEKGRANQDALDSIADAALRSASAEYELSGSQEQATKRILEGREELVKAARAMGMSEAEAKKLADRILGIPKRWRTEFSSNARGQSRQVRELRDLVRGLHDRHITITTDYVNRYITQQFGVNAPQVRRFGGVSFARHGLLNLTGMASIFPDGANLFGFAERGTGGEAFVARNAPRGRSLSILDAAAGWHDAIVTPIERLTNAMSATGRGGGVDSRPVGPAQVQVLVELDGQVIEPRMVRVLDGFGRQVREVARMHGAKPALMKT